MDGDTTRWGDAGRPVRIRKWPLRDHEGVKLAELVLEAVEGRHVGALDRRVARASAVLAGGALVLGLRARRTGRGR